MFEVELLNPTAGAEVGVGATISVVINPSDNAFGVFQFADSSLAVQSNETGDTGYNNVSLQVMVMPFI